MKRALTLEPNLADGHATMAWIQMLYDWDWRGAEVSFRRALELAPGNATVLRRAGVLAMLRGRLEEGIGLYRSALEQNPLSAHSYSNLGMALHAANRSMEAEGAYRKALELAPQKANARGLLSLTLLAQGRNEEALAEATGESDENSRLWALAIVHHVLGNRAESDEMGIPLVGLILPDWVAPGFGWILPSAAVTNGLFYGLAWYLGRIAVKGERAAMLVVVLGVGLWTARYVQWCVENMPRREPPPMPVDLASPLAGRWEGVIHGARGDRPVSLLCHPRTDGKLDGLLYVNGALMGPLEEGTFAGDSLHFDVNAFQHRGHRDSVQITIESTASGMTQVMELRFVSADTARLALPPEDP